MMGRSFLRRQILTGQGHYRRTLAPDATVFIGTHRHFIGNEHPKKAVYSLSVRSLAGSMQESLAAAAMLPLRLINLIRTNGRQRRMESISRSGWRNVSKTSGSPFPWHKKGNS